MTVAVVVPWRAGCTHREAAWHWVRHRYETDHPTWEIVAGELNPGESWSKGVALARAIASTPADVLVVADADVWVCDLATTVEQVQSRYPWAMPHGNVYRLRQEATAQVLAGADVTTTARVAANRAQRPYRGMPGGGIVVVRRSTWDAVPVDRRFIGWGGEDESWDRALRTLARGGTRRNGALYHLWHPPQARLTRRVGSEANLELAARYRAATSNVEVMAALVEEGRHA